MALSIAAQLLLVEEAAIEPILRAATEEDLAVPTVCDGWSVRDVMAHCGAALTRTASGGLHSFSPADNEADVVERRSWPAARVLAELVEGYRDAAIAIDAAGDALDGVALGEWMHGGDIRDALGVPGAYTSEGIELALQLLVERSQRLDSPAITVQLERRSLDFGSGRPVAQLTCDTETFVRACGGRRPDPRRYEIDGDCAIGDLVLFG